MKLYVGVTDRDWYDFLSARPGLDDVNFWQPSGGRRFSAISPGDLFLFKLHYPANAIVGGGTFVSFDSFPAWLVWDAFQERNSLRDSLARLWRHPAIVDELLQLLLELDRRSERLPFAEDDVDEPIAVHAVYSRDEVLAALGDANAERPPTMREGVRWIEDAQADIFFVTLRKSEERFSPTTMYRDFALSPIEFHWESQSTTTESSPTGQRYIHHGRSGSRVLLFVRDTASSPFVYLGPADYHGHRGERPMSITWHLEREMPPDFFLEARAVG